MRIALISDIHGNLVALEAVLKDIEKRRVDQLICLGDVATLGPQPREVVARVRALNCPCVLGNHETNLIDRGSVRRSIWVETVAWCIEQLSADDLHYLGTFQPTLEVQLDEDNHLLCFHGSPLSNRDSIIAPTPDDELDAMLGEHQATIMAGGHTHVQMLRRHKGMTIINVGSVGIPFKRHLPNATEVRFLPWAEYAILDWENGAAGIDFRRVPIDFEALQQASAASSNPFNWMAYWFAPGSV